MICSFDLKTYEIYDNTHINCPKTLNLTIEHHQLFFDIRIHISKITYALQRPQQQKGELARQQSSFL